ncbi:hypothetical protein GCM10010250_50010 [Streptomyces althioticus]|nr:hypothetical protein GCM10010250_50010 [Streptomyces althioticus]
MGGALDAVERVDRIVDRVHLEGEGVVVPAHFTDRHDPLPSAVRAEYRAEADVMRVRCGAVRDR